MCTQRKVINNRAELGMGRIMMEVHTSNVDPLPHQITAVYEPMTPKQPIRYVLTDSSVGVLNNDSTVTTF